MKWNGWADQPPSRAQTQKKINYLAAGSPRRSIHGFRLRPSVDQPFMGRPRVFGPLTDDEGLKA